MKKFITNPWIISIIINTVVLLAVMLLTDTAYETNDDYVISLRIADGYPYSSFVNYFLCRILIGIQSMLPGINVFTVMQIFASWVSFVCITRVFMDTMKNRDVLTVAFFIMTVFAADHYSILQFTRTSALMLTCGMLLLIHSMIHRKGFGWYLTAFALIYPGTWMRDMNLIVAIGSAGIFLVAWVIINRRELIPEGYLKPKRILIYAVCLLLLGGAAGTSLLTTHINNSTEELAKFSDYDYYRSLATDYPVYEDYEKNREDYETAGISENDLYLISNWYLDYNGAASGENLKKINEIYKSHGGETESVTAAVKEAVSGCLDDVKDFNRRGMHLIIIGLLLIAGIIAYKPRYLPYLFGTCLFAGVLYLYLFYVGRPLYRATYIADIGTIVWMLYYFDSRYLRKREVGSGALRAAAGLCIIALVACQAPVIKASKQLHSYGVNNCISEEMADFIKDNEENFYVFGKGTRGLSEYYATPLRVPEEGYQKNALGFGSWGTKSPYILDKLEAYGLENTFEDLIDNDKAFLFEDKNVSRLTEYMNKWYGDSFGEIYPEKAGEVDGHSMWRMRSR